MAAAIRAIRRQNKRKKEAAEQARLAALGRLGEPDASDTSATHDFPETSKTNPNVHKDILPYQAQVRAFYGNSVVTMAVALLIVLNFIGNILEKEIDPSSMFGASWGRPDRPTKYPEVWLWMEGTFNVLFAIELVINWYGLWFSQFWRSGWNIFDFIVVVNGLLNLAKVDLGPLSLLRMLRAFRVFRLFKRVKSLNKIITALVKAVPGVVNAFTIMLIVMCIFAILAVEFFSAFGADGEYTTTYVDEEGTLRNVTVSSISARGLGYGDEYFGTFSRSLYTMFQVMTGESWSEMVARPLVFGWSGWATGLFYVTFILLTQIILTNVVVAVLLEKMVADDDDDNSQQHYHQQQQHQQLSGAHADAAVPTPPKRDIFAKREKTKKGMCDGVKDLQSQVPYAHGPSSSMEDDSDSHGNISADDMGRLHSRMYAVEQSLFKVDAGIEDLQEQVRLVNTSLNSITSLVKGNMTGNRLPRRV